MGDLQAREDFYKLMTCELCGKPMSYVLTKIKAEKDLVEFKVHCSQHEGRRSLTIANFKYLLAAGIGFKGSKRDPDEFIALIEDIQRKMKSSKLKTVLFAGLSIIIYLLMGILTSVATSNQSSIAIGLIIVNIFPIFLTGYHITRIVMLKERIRTELI